MDRVVVSRPFMGLLAMQVCACKDASDDEILHVCNRDNVCGTSHGWAQVVRTYDPEHDFTTKDSLPVQCEDHADRLHFVVYC